MTGRNGKLPSLDEDCDQMASNALTPIANLDGRQSGESKIVTAAVTIPPPTPSNPIAARRVSVSAANKPGIVRPSVEANELGGKRIVGWGITHPAGEPPVFVLLAKGDDEVTRYELHVADRGARPPAQRTQFPLDAGFLGVLGGLECNVDAKVDGEGVRIMSAAVVPRPERAWENNGAVRIVERLALRLVVEQDQPETRAGHARTASIGPKTVFVKARTTERDRPRNTALGSHVPNDGSDEEADHVGDRSSFGEDVVLVKV